jgi:predicted transposase/invertase (TIGR01784 family)
LPIGCGNQSTKPNFVFDFDTKLNNLIDYSMEQSRSKTNGRYMNLKTDFAFKHVLFNEKDQTLLINFLNEILRNEEKITNIRYLPTERLGNTEKERKAIYDLYCENDRGEKLIIEMQVCKQAHIIPRCLYYITFPIQEQARKGNWDFNMLPVYHIAIVDFIHFENQKCVNYLALMNEETYEKGSDLIHLITVELPKFKKQWEDLQTGQDYWLYCFNHLPDMQEPPGELSGTIFDKLFETTEVNTLTSDNMEAYTKSLAEYGDVRRMMDYSRNEGVEIGIEKGIARGINFRNSEIAKTLRNMGMPVTDISKVTGLTPEQILEIK